MDVFQGFAPLAFDGRPVGAFTVARAASFGVFFSFHHPRRWLEKVKTAFREKIVLNAPGERDYVENRGGCHLRGVAQWSVERRKVL